MAIRSSVLELPFVQASPSYGNGGSLPGNGDNQIVDVFAAKLPVGSIHTEGVTAEIQPVQDQLAQLFITVGVTNEKALDTSITGFRLSFALKGFSNAVKIA